MNILQRLKNIFGDDFLTRFTEDELDIYIAEGLTEYARRSGAFVAEYSLDVSSKGIVNLPSEVITVLTCNDLPLKSWRSVASLHGGQWFNKTSRDAECFIIDFDSCNQFRVFPIPENKKVVVKCLIGEEIVSFDKTQEAVTQYVCAMMLLREYNGESSIYLNRFDELSRPPLVRTTSINGIYNKGVWF